MVGLVDNYVLVEQYHDSLQNVNFVSFTVLDRYIWVAVSGFTSPKHLGLKLLALCALPLVPSVISRGAPRQAT
jgi:hypothetical protein